MARCSHFISDYNGQCLVCASDRLRAENARLIEEKQRLSDRIAELEAALRQAADESNIDKARKIADAVLGKEGA